MADYFTQCSVLIPYDSREELAWLEDEFRVAEGNACITCRKWEEECQCEEFIQPDCSSGLDYEVHIPYDPDGKEPNALWVRDSDGSAEPNILCDIIERFQIMFQKTQPWECSFAHTCSKPRLDAFSGYSVLIHRGQTYYLSPTDEPMALVRQCEQLRDFAYTLPSYF